MKCDKCIQLLEKFENNLISTNEKEDMYLHIKNCDTCKQEFRLIEKYKLISINLQQYKPILKDKEQFVDRILNQLPDKEIKINAFNHSSNQLFPYKFRLAVASLAASLIMLLAMQQTFDAWKIKQLENKFVYQQKPINYSLLKATIMINLLNPKATYNFTGMLSKAKRILRKQTFAMFKIDYSLLTKSETKKICDPGSVFYADSTNNP